MMLYIILILICFLLTYVYFQRFHVTSNLKKLYRLSIRDSLKALSVKNLITIKLDRVKELMKIKASLYLRWRGRYEVVVVSASLANVVYKNTGIFRKWISAEQRPSWSYLGKAFGFNVVFSNDEIWRRHRSTANPAFKFSIIKNFVKPFNDLTYELMGIWDAQEGKPLKVSDWTARFALEALGVCAFSLKMNNLSDENSKYAKSYNNVVHRLFVPARLLTPFSLYDLIPTQTNRDLKTSLKEFHNILDQIIDNKRKLLADEEKIINNDVELEDENMINVQDMNNNVKQSKQHDLLDLLIQSVDGKSKLELSTKELRDNLLIFFLAGHDTSAKSMAVTLFLLAKYPNIQEKVFQEIQDVIGNDKDISFEQQAKLEYLTMCLYETIRLYPPVMELPPRIVGESTTLGDTKLEKNQVVVVDIFSIHRDPEYFERPNEFYPEHFTSDQVKARNKKNRYAYQPFGGGSRMCLGKNFSILEQRIFLSQVLRRYKFSLTNEVDNEEVCINIRTDMLNKVIVHRR